MPHDTPEQFGVQHAPCGSLTVEHTCPAWQVPEVQKLPQPTSVPHALPSQLALVQRHMPELLMHV
jgi:hypothetical protein